MTNRQIIRKLFPACKSIESIPFEEIDTVSGGLLGERALLRYKVTDVDDKKHGIVLKRKNGLVVPLGAAKLSPSLGVFLKVLYAHRIFGFDNGQKREKLFYEKIDDSLKNALPSILGMYELLGGQSTVLVMDEFPQGNIINSKDIYKIIDLITDFHAKYYGKKWIVQKMKLNNYTPGDYRRTRGTLKALFNYYYDDNLKIYGEKLTKELSEFIDHIDTEFALVMKRRTLTHNDFTPRNISVDGGKIIFYDWELACYQNPEHDLVELLISSVNDDCDIKEIRKMINYYRKTLAKKIKQEISDEDFAKAMRFNVLEYCVSRLAIYRSYSRKKQGDVVKRCVKNVSKVLEACL